MASNQPNLHWLWLIQREKACSINYEIIIMIIIWFKLQSNFYYLNLEYQNFSITWTCFSSPIFFPSNKADWRYSIRAASKNDRNKDTLLLWQLGINWFKSTLEVIKRCCKTLLLKNVFLINIHFLLLSGLLIIQAIQPSPCKSEWWRFDCSLNLKARKNCFATIGVNL